MSEAKREILIPALQISCVLGHSFHTWSDNLRAQFQPSLTACTELKCQPEVKAWCLFWACIQPWAHIWSSRFPGFVGRFSRSFSLMCLLLQPVPPQAFWSVCCLSVCHPLPQVAFTTVFIFKYFQPTPSGRPSQPEKVLKARPCTDSLAPHR